MPDVLSTMPDPVVVEICWHEPEIGETRLSCRFSVNGCRHVVDGHFRNPSESWGRVLPQSLVQRLASQARTGKGWLPTAEDLRAFADGVSAQMRASCERPMICLYAERALGHMRGGQRQKFSGGPPAQKIMFVLQSGAVAFVAVDGQPQPAMTLAGRFLSCYFPRAPGWRESHRAFAEAAQGFVRKWARHIHRSGKPRLPDPEVKVRSDHDGFEVERKQFRFVTPEAWGFRRESDGVFVFVGVPAWK